MNIVLERRQNMFNRDFFRWDPFRDFERNVGSLFSGVPRRARYSAYPLVNIWGNNEGLSLEAEIPGADPDKLNISVEGNRITISGTREAGGKEEETSFHRRERETGSFKREFELPYDVEAEKIDASYEMGVLTVRMSRHEKDKPRKIEVKAS